MRRESFKAWFTIHKWTSLVCMVFMLMLCVTGLPLIFHHEIDHALGYSAEAPEGVAAGSQVPVDVILEEARQRHPEEVVQFLVADPEEPALWYVRLGTSLKSEDISAFLSYDARTGEHLGAYPLGEGIMNVFLRLHVDMFAGLPGTLFLGAMGLLLFLSIVSGAVLYAPYMRRLSFGTLRSSRSTRIRWLDLHNFLGIVTLVWLSVVTITGVVNTLSVPIFGHWQSNQLEALTAPYKGRPTTSETAAVTEVLEAARQTRPGTQLSFLAFPGNDFASPHHFVAFMQGRDAWSSKLLTPVLVDAETAEVVATPRMPWYVSLLLVSQPLHFGDYGGLPLKILWALLDVLAIVVLLSGLYLWVLRRRRVSKRLMEMHSVEEVA